MLSMDSMVDGVEGHTKGLVPLGLPLATERGSEISSLFGKGPWLILLVGVGGCGSLV